MINDPDNADIAFVAQRLNKQFVSRPTAQIATRCVLRQRPLQQMTKDAVPCRKNTYVILDQPPSQKHCITRENSTYSSRLTNSSCIADVRIKSQYVGRHND